jgi:hypothetical protein
MTNMFGNRQQEQHIGPASNPIRLVGAFASHSLIRAVERAFVGDLHLAIRCYSDALPKFELPTVNASARTTSSAPSLPKTDNPIGSPSSSAIGILS